jgi:hypothetical protein
MGCSVGYSRYCTELRIGTQKHIDNYIRNTIRQHSIYRPVYDTIELKKMYPNLDRESYFDTLMLSRQIIPLTNLDSMLINQALAFKGNTTCNNYHLKLIRGFIFVRTDEVKVKKEKDFKTSKNKSRAANIQFCVSRGDEHILIGNTTISYISD